MFDFKRYKNWLIKYLTLWGSVMLLVCGCLLIGQNQARNHIDRSGMLLCKQISSLIKTPLLDKNFQDIHYLLRDLMKQPDLAAYVVFDQDHKIIASVAKDYLTLCFNETSPTIILEEAVSREILAPTGRRLICFSSGIRSSGFQIGEMHFAFFASKLDSIAYGFMILEIFGAVILLWPISVLIYQNRRKILTRSGFWSRLRLPPLTFSSSLLFWKRWIGKKEITAIPADAPEHAGGKRISKTFWWIKQLSTFTFLHVYRKILEWEAFTRIKKQIGFCLLIWFFANLGAFLFYYTAVEKQYSSFYRKGISLTYGLADKIGLALLQEDFLRIGTAVGDYSREPHLVSVAVLDHQGQIVAHTESSMGTRSLPPMKKKETAEILEGTLFEYGLLPDERTGFYVSRDILFLDQKIGKVYFSFSSEVLHGPIHRFRVFLMAGFICGVLVLAAVIFLMVHISKTKTLKSQKRMEGLTRIGPYILLNKIGQGGMAELFLADYIREDGFRKTVALKKIRPHLAEHPDFVKMFIHEARVAALLQHPNIVQTIDFGNIENVYFMAMEYVEGKNLGEIMTHFRSGLPMAQSVHIISKIARGLDYSHTKKDDTTGDLLNVVHCDISLENILVSFQGEVKISDFGISKAAIGGSRPLLRDGTIKGKLAYLSPEQVLGQPINHQTDLYSLGLVSYTLLTGKIAQNFKSELEALKTIPKMDIPPLTDTHPDLPFDLNAIVMKCLEKDRANRYQHTQELYEDLTALKTRLHIIYDETQLAAFMKSHFSGEMKNRFNDESGHKPGKIISLN